MRAGWLRKHKTFGKVWKSFGKVPKVRAGWLHGALEKGKRRKTTRPPGLSTRSTQATMPKRSYSPPSEQPARHVAGSALSRVATGSKPGRGNFNAKPIRRPSIRTVTPSCAVPATVTLWSCAKTRRAILKLSHLEGRSLALNVEVNVCRIYYILTSIGLVVEYIIAIDVTQVRFPADAWVVTPTC